MTTKDVMKICHILSLRGKMVGWCCVSNCLCPGIYSCKRPDHPATNVMCQFWELSKLPPAKRTLNLNTCIAGLVLKLAPRCPGFDSVLSVIRRSTLLVLFSASRLHRLFLGYSRFFSTSSVIPRRLRFFLAYSDFPLSPKFKTSFDLLWSRGRGVV